MKKDFDILVIDDEKIVLNAVTKICAFEKYSIDTASDGIEALDKIHNKKYGLVLCDIMMPEMDGFKFLEEFRKKNSITPIIITSGFSTNDYAVKALHDGALDFLPKPFTFEELSNTIHRGMNYYKLNEEIADGLRVSGKTHSLYVACPPQYYRLGYLSWARLSDDGTAEIGIVNLFFELIESTKNLRLQKEESKIFQGNYCMTIIDSSDNEHSVPSPLSGKIIEINNKVIENINLLGKDPYFEGWIYRIIPSNIEYELKQLTPCSSDRV